MKIRTLACRTLWLFVATPSLAEEVAEEEEGEEEREEAVVVGVVEGVVGIY